MHKYIIALPAAVVLFLGLSSGSALAAPTLTATLSSTGPASKSIPPDSRLVDVAKITLKATGEDIYLNGVEVDTDVPGGLSHFTELRIYSGSTLMGAYPHTCDRPNHVEFKNAVRIGNGLSKTYLIRASLSDSAAGNVRVGFSGFTFSTLEKPTLVNVPIYGNTMSLVDDSGNTIPTPTPTPTPPPALASDLPAPCLAAGHREGDVINAQDASDPDIYVLNGWGYKRLFLNPVIFGFYGHLGGFLNVKNVFPSERDSMPTSGLVRNCETNDPRVYGVETTGEDTGLLHWVNTTGEQAVADDPEFFKKVFCINSAEFNWYTGSGKKFGSEYTSVNQIPSYSR